MAHIETTLAQSAFQSFTRKEVKGLFFPIIYSHFH